MADYNPPSIWDDPADDPSSASYTGEGINSFPTDLEINPSGISEEDKAGHVYDPASDPSSSSYTGENIDAFPGMTPGTFDENGNLDQGSAGPTIAPSGISEPDKAETPGAVNYDDVPGGTGWKETDYQDAPPPVPTPDPAQDDTPPVVDTPDDTVKKGEITAATAVPTEWAKKLAELSDKAAATGDTAAKGYADAAEAARVAYEAAQARALTGGDEAKKEAEKAKADMDAAMGALSGHFGSQGTAQATELRADAQSAWKLFSDLAAKAATGSDEDRAKAEEARKKYEALYDQWNASQAGNLQKTTAERMDESRAYAQGAAQEGALAQSNAAIKQAFKAARTAGMLPGQAALLAAQEAGSSFSQAYQGLLAQYDQAYQAADAGRRAEIEREVDRTMTAANAEATRAAEIRQAGINTEAGITKEGAAAKTASTVKAQEAENTALAAQAGLAQFAGTAGLEAMKMGQEAAAQGRDSALKALDSQTATALDAVKGMTAAQQEAINQQLNATMGAQEGMQRWASLTLQEKLAELQKQGQNTSNTLDVVGRIIGVIGSIAGLFL